MGWRQQEGGGGAERERERGSEGNKQRRRGEKENKKRACHSCLISALSASIAAPSAGSSHTNRQAIWLHYCTHTHTFSNSLPYTHHTLLHTHRCKHLQGEEEEVRDELNEESEEEDITAL